MRHWRAFAKWFYQTFIEPKKELEDARRNEFVLNVVLVAGIILLFWGEIFIVRSTLVGNSPQHNVGLALFSGMLGANILALFLSRKGFIRLSAWIILSIFFLGTSYGAFRWGANLPAVLLGYAIVVVCSGILISSKASLVVTLASSCVIYALAILDTKGIYTPDFAWKKLDFGQMDATQYSIMLFMILTISWLSDSENRRLFKKAKQSEIALQQEKDLLEIKVEERTKEIRKIQSEKIAQLYTFAEIGKVAAGALHDLANPLTAVSLNIENMKRNPDIGPNNNVDRALSACKTMKEFLESTRQQLQANREKSYFSVNTEFQGTIDLIEHRKKGTSIKIITPIKDSSLYGNPAKFSQIILNLLSNSIDAYVNNGKTGEIEIIVDEKPTLTTISIRDNAGGMPPEIEQKIFTPFYTTKGEKGTGLGLTTTKTIIEKDFHGSITCKNQYGKGATFICKFPRS